VADGMGGPAPDDRSRDAQRLQDARAVRRFSFRAESAGDKVDTHEQHDRRHADVLTGLLSSRIRGTRDLPSALRAFLHRCAAVRT